MMHAAVNDALSAGFKGLCAARDMSWPLHEAPGSERLAEYEARLNHFYKAQRALALCQYNHSKLPPATIDHEIATHRSVRMARPLLLENPFHEEPELTAERKPKLREVARKTRHFRRERDIRRLHPKHLRPVYYYTSGW
jgi:hypothetical protein